MKNIIILNLKNKKHKKKLYLDFIFRKFIPLKSLNTPTSHKFN